MLRAPARLGHHRFDAEIRDRMDVHGRGIGGAGRGDAFETARVQEFPQITWEHSHVVIDGDVTPDDFPLETEAV